MSFECRLDVVWMSFDLVGASSSQRAGLHPHPMDVDVLSSCPWIMQIGGLCSEWQNRHDTTK